MTKKDSLTGLYDYETFLSLFEARLHTSGSVEESALFCIEFDDLSRFNDTFGIDIDEQLLLQISQVFTQITDENDIVARAGNYRFLWLCDRVSDRYKADEKAQSILNLLQEPFCIEGNMFYVTVSIGATLLSKEQKESASKIIKRTENSMRRAQKKGTNHIVFTQNKVNPYIKTELKLMKDLPSAIDNGEVYFVYQGQYGYKTDSFTGAELLARWEHPELGNIPPSVFIPLAEKSGMIGPLTTKILIETSQLFEELESLGINEFSISVNISPYVLMEKSFCDTVSFLIEHYGLKGRRLNFEIMEDTIAQNLDNFSQLLHKIKRRGIGIEIDDYGTGHTSLNYLISLPIDSIKIDRSFVSDIDKHQKKYALLRALVDMAKALELDVIIEGVERAEEAALLSDYKEIKVQGYYYTRPLKKEAFFSLIAPVKKG
jgi:diguanylate cyclase (GGDEF)-like protein